MLFEEGKKFARMYEMDVMPHKYKSEDCTFFEPKPYDVFDDSTLHGCLRQFAKVENLFDKQNLYLCEKCTEEKYGKSKKNNI